VETVKIKIITNNQEIELNVSKIVSVDVNDKSFIYF
jgi:hypothetical protein